jgi:AcrR family transcriptional regulator
MGTRKYEQRLRAETAEETRRHILDAVYERLRAAPAQPVSVEQVARTARVARSTVYLIFGSRAGLFDAVAKDLMERGGFDRVVTAVAHPDAR